jgi:hypothetical protein
MGSSFRNWTRHHGEFATKVVHQAIGAVASEADASGRMVTPMGEAAVCGARLDVR